MKFTMPAEYEKHAATIMIWCEREGSWSYKAKFARPIFKDVISHICRGERVYLAVSPTSKESAYNYLEKEIEEGKVFLLDIPTNDCWARDTAPTFIRTSEGIKGIDWKFNAWGGDFDGLYRDFDLDDKFASELLKRIGFSRIDAGDFVLEGGSIHSNGEGLILTTEECLLSKGRNPKLNKAEIEARLKELLNADKVLWLPYGIYGDETNGHIDNICAFTAKNRVLLAWTDEGEQGRRCRIDEEVLLQAGLEVVRIPLPKLPVRISESDIRGLKPNEGEDMREVGEQLAASYVNFYVANSCVLVPIFGDVNDKRALEIIKREFPQREVVAIPAREIIVGGGNIHCLTQQIPKVDMRKVKVACVQMSCKGEREENIARAKRFIREAAGNGAEIVLLPELFERWYFCQERNYDYYAFAESVEDNLAIREIMPLTEELGVVVPVSFYEKCGNVLYNSVAILDCGKNLGVYRKTHIPDDHYYQEKFYFTPGNTGFKTFKTTYGTIGVGICWDQWFSETARCLALNGAELMFFPTAIGSEPILGTDSKEHWQRVMQGHAATNLMPVVAANRIGEERVSASKENGGQTSALNFYGSSFITDNTGKMIAEMDRTSEGIIYADYDLDELQSARFEWGLFRDRRPSSYKEITK